MSGDIRPKGASVSEPADRVVEQVQKLLASVAEEGKGPSGRVLMIREKSDESTSDCPAWRDEPKSLHGT